MAQIDCFAKWATRAKEPWNENTYRNTEVIIGNPLATKATTVKVVIVEPDDKGMERGIQKMYKDRFNVITEAREDFEVMEVTTKVRSKNVNAEHVQKIIKIEVDAQAQELWDKLKMLREETRGDDLVCLHHLEGYSISYLRKMVEAVFHNANTMVSIYTTKAKEMEDSTSQKQPDRKTQRDLQTYAIIVDHGGQENRKVIEEVKAEISRTTHKKEIRSIRTSRDGKLVITTERSLEAIQELQKCLQGGERKISTRTNGANKRQGKTLHIRGMDLLAEEHEVMAAIKEEFDNLKDEDIYLSKLRLNAGNTQAITVTLPEKEAQTLLEQKTIRIGLVKCGVREHVNLQRCRRCWSFNHIEDQCNGPDRRGHCYKCGTAGHMANECKQEESCPLCHVIGHRAGSFRCKDFKKSFSVHKSGKIDTEKKIVDATIGAKPDEKQMEIDTAEKIGVDRSEDPEEEAIMDPQWLQ